MPVSNVHTYGTCTHLIFYPICFVVSAVLSRSSALSSLGSTGPSKGVGDKRRPPIAEIPADTEAPYTCFPMACVYCQNAVPLRSPLKRMHAMNTRILTEYRALAESAVGNPNRSILATGVGKLPASL